MPAPLAEVYIREKKQGGNSHDKIFKKEGTPFGYTVFGLGICGDMEAQSLHSGFEGIPQ